jgi:TldD protein
VEVGRYDVVIGPKALAGIVSSTIGRALAADVALGYKAYNSGTSYAAPPLEVLGKYRVGNDLITVTADRSRPTACATVGWDEEGVKPDDFPLVRDGIITDFLTTRATAPELAPYYTRLGTPVRSHGCAAGTGANMPALTLPNLTLQPGTTPATAEDLCKDIKRGIYVVQGFASSDQQHINTVAGAELAYEIVNGKPTRILKDVVLQFSTSQFWKSIDALGGPESAALQHIFLDDPTNADTLPLAGVQCVPVRVRQLNIANSGKQA